MTTNADLSNWSPRPAPLYASMEGQYVRLEPLEANAHGDDLFAVTYLPDREVRFLFWHKEKSPAPANREEFQTWMNWAANSRQDPLIFAVIDKATGKVGGRQSLMRIDPANGVVEIGAIYWGPSIAGTRIATEAFYLFAKHIFELGYRRLEWKCDNLNEHSKRAAQRFGFRFEGIFRQHKVEKGRNRDTAWYSMLDSEWPQVKEAIEEWLKPDNFDANGQQKTRLRRICNEDANAQ